MPTHKPLISRRFCLAMEKDNFRTTPVANDGEEPLPLHAQDGTTYAEGDPAGGFIKSGNGDLRGRQTRNGAQ